MEEIDLRSDTVTQPTPAMREAMYRAEVGDDSRGDDPTVRRLQELAASKVGKEAALYIPSGTMGNLLAHMTHCNHGDEVILGDMTHTFLSEVTNAAALHGISFRTIPNDGPRMDLGAVEGAIRPGTELDPRTGLIWLENTHVCSGGRVLSLADMAATREMADRHGLPVHLDGARIFNAATKLGCDASEIAQHVDSVMFCLSKGLSAPVGSMLCGTADFIVRARKYCKMLGGRMRQAGVIAAAGIVALENMIERLQEDHDNAQILAGLLAEIDGVRLDPGQVETNIVLPQLDAQFDATDIRAKLTDRGILTLPYGRDGIRMVTHYGIEEHHVHTAAKALQAVLYL